MNRRTSLFIRPKDCRVCEHGYYGLLHPINHSNAQGFNTIDLSWTQAERVNVESTVPIVQPFLIHGFGHGNVNIYTGNSETAIFHTSFDLTYLAGSVIYLLSCLTANELGPYLITQGVLGYGGFLIAWTWMCDGPVSGDPYEDIYAHGFYESSNEFFISLLDIETLQQAYDRSVAKYNDWIDYWSNEGSGDPYASQAIGWLIHDRDGLVLYGDTSVKAIECETIQGRQECIDGGCWWYDGECHCECPTDIRDIHDLNVHVIVIPPTAHIRYWNCPSECYTNIPVHAQFTLENIGNHQGYLWMRILKLPDTILWTNEELFSVGEINEYDAYLYLSQECDIRLEVGHYE